MTFGSIALLLLSSGCNFEQIEEEKRFTLLNPEETGVDFVNQLSNTKYFNILSYLYFYNGGGVAIGDVNRDNLPDIYFSANQLPNRLYINEGNFKFRDATKEAGVGGRFGWKTGVSMADVNGDGWLDIYVCYLGDFIDKKGTNQLFINQQDGAFVDRAADYGLDLTGFSTQAVFFDYDLDGDLDMFQLNHSVNPAGTVGDTSQRSIVDPLAGDKLMRNDNGMFVDVSRKAGLIRSKLGYGLGAIVNDFNMDGWPDLYVTNDFHEDDYLYINLKNGSFDERLSESVGHTSKFSMGADAADINRDGMVDFLTLDMKPFQQKILKTSEPPESYDLFEFKRSFGYYYQYPHNALQLNLGDGKFSEIAQMSGVDATDWSWSALFSDFDNDGLEDLYITNGIFRRPNDMDYLKFISNPLVVQQLNSTPTDEELDFIQQMPQVPLANFMYKNRANLTFEKVSDAWGTSEKAFSNGAAYSDLDNDGDLDLIVNNINTPAFLYRNETVAKVESINGSGGTSSSDNYYLFIDFKGIPPNTFGVGASVYAHYNNVVQYKYHMPTRGFLSSVEPRMHIGLGRIKNIDSLRVIWPDGSTQCLQNVAANQTIQLSQSNALQSYNYDLASADKDSYFRSVPFERLPFEHRENDFNDINQQPLIPHMLSKEGPALAIADINGDGLEDVYVGGAANQAGQLFLQQAGRFFQVHQKDLWEQVQEREEVDCLFFDADGDKDQDLYIVCGGNEFTEDYALYKDLFYVNDGKGNFSLNTSAFPSLRSNGSCVTVGDLDNDDDLDLFVGTRNVPGAYGLGPESFLLRNDGKGEFSLVEENWTKDLRYIGMVTDAIWHDYNMDGLDDLIVVGEWTDIEIWQQDEGVLVRKTTSLGLNGNKGWWNTIVAGDWDKDGDTDFIAGNLGLNSTLRTSKDEPCTLYVGDFDMNGSIDPILCYYLDGESYPFANKDLLQEQLPFIRKEYGSYSAFAEETILDLLLQAEGQALQVLSVHTFEHQYIEQVASKFQLTPLPRLAQMSPIYSILSTDVNNDGWEDLILGGNFSAVSPSRGKYDASKGLWIQGGENVRWKAIPPRQSQLWIEGEVKAMKLLNAESEEPWIIVAKNNDPLQIISHQKPPPATRSMLSPLKRNNQVISVLDLLQQGSLTIEKQLSKEEYFQMVEEYPNLKLELDRKGNIKISSTVSEETERLATQLHSKIGIWANDSAGGMVLHPKTKIEMPNGSILSPACAWISKRRLRKLESSNSLSGQSMIVPLVPDFVIEISTDLDPLGNLHKRMEKEWLSNGVKLAWLIDPYQEIVNVYEQGQTPKILKGFHSLTLEAERLSPGLKVEMRSLSLAK